MDTLAQTAPVGYAFGVSKAHTAGRCPPAYTPLADGTPAEAASAPWSESDRDEWADARARDAERESGGGW